MLGWLVGVAFGCGGFFGPEGSEVFSDAQQVVLRAGAGGVEVEYLVDYGGEGLPEFGWVVPIPGAFVTLEEGDPAAFDALRARTVPETRYVSEPPGCGPAAKGGDALSGGTSNSYEIVAQGRVGVFDYAVIAGTDPVAITDWLAAQGWSVGPSGPAIEAYVADGGWQFVAVALNEEVASEGTGGLAVARIAYEGSDLVFPARMSRYSMAPEQSTTVWVVGDQRATVQGWAETELGDDEVVGRWDFAEAVRDAVGDGEPTYAVTFAGELDGAFVTRFDTVTASAAHDADASFRLDGGQVTHAPVVTIYESEEARRAEERGCATVGGLGPVAWVAAFGVLARSRRRRSG